MYGMSQRRITVTNWRKSTAKPKQVKTVVTVVTRQKREHSGYKTVYTGTRIVRVW